VKAGPTLPLLLLLLLVLLFEIARAIRSDGTSSVITSWHYSSHYFTTTSYAPGALSQEPRALSQEPRALSPRGNDECTWCTIRSQVHYLRPLLP
jgi:hypothetical protein